LLVVLVVLVVLVLVLSPLFIDISVSNSNKKE
jgi:hypothetical protein